MLPLAANSTLHPPVEVQSAQPLSHSIRHVPCWMSFPLTQHDGFAFPMLPLGPVVPTSPATKVNASVFGCVLCLSPVQGDELDG
jgi:hypothetical protein